MSANPYISIVMAVKNNAQTLEQSINSVARQTFQEKELLIIDGVSVDGSIDILKNYSNYISFWTSEPDTGIYNAWNKALKKIKGEWVIFLGADDYFWHETVLERVSEYLKDIDSRIDVFYGSIIIVDQEGSEMGKVGSPWEKAQVELRYRASIPHPGTFYRSHVFDKYGGFDENLKISGDYDFLLRVLKNNSAYFCDDLIITAMRSGGISSTTSNALIKLKEDYRVIRNNGLKINNYYWLRKFIVTYGRELIKYLLGPKYTLIIEEKIKKILN